MNDRTISVVIPAYNAAATLSACLDSLRSQSRPPLEIIVVDDCSRDATMEVARMRGATVISLAQNSGPGVARNAGAAAAAGEILAFTDSDCVPPVDWLERITAPLNAAGVVAATGGYAGPVRETFLTRLQDQILRIRQRSLPSEIESTITSNFACKRGAFVAVGGFPLYARKRDPAKPIWGNEDEELGFLLTRDGSRIRWVADAGVYHAYRGSLLGFLRQQKFYAERIVMSHFRFPEMAEAQSNYSRSSGVIHLGATLALGLSPFLVAVAPYVHHCASWLSVPFFVVAVMSFLLLPVPLVLRLRRQGNGISFLFKAFPVLLAVSLAWLGGAVTGTLLTIGGFIHVTQQPRPTSAALVQ